MENLSSIEKNKKIILKYFYNLWNERNLEVLDEIISPNYINHSPSIQNPEPGPNGLKPIIEEMFLGFPDLHYEILDLIATKNSVVTRLQVTGTHSAKIWGIDATGNKFNVSQMNIEYIKDGMITEHWRLTDELLIMKQLGIVK